VPPFLPGLELSRAYYGEVVAPLLGDTPHAATRLGWGSDVLGLDTERSTDHGWGPRLEVFVEEDATERVRLLVDESLPEKFRGWPTRFGWDDVPVSHHVTIDTLDGWLQAHLGFDPLAGVTTRDWLTTPQQLLLEVTAGDVFHDPSGRITAARAALAWYPEDVWLWLMACQWRRLDQEEPFVGRAAEVGDDLGSRLVAGRLVRDVMRLCFLQERRYAPYAKWLGSAFRTLDAGATLCAPMAAALAAEDYASREEALVAIVEELARRHNMLELTEPLDVGGRPFHTRPYRVLGSHRFVDACLGRVDDPALRVLPTVGSVDQWADSTDLLSETLALPGARAAYEAWSSRA
jgi:hypothetical protein